MGAVARAHSCFAYVPEDIRRFWAGMAGSPDYRDIFLLEAIGPSLLLIVFPLVVQERAVVSFD